MPSTSILIPITPLTGDFGKSTLTGILKSATPARLTLDATLEQHKKLPVVVETGHPGQRFITVPTAAIFQRPRPLAGADKRWRKRRTTTSTSTRTIVVVTNWITVVTV